MLALTHTQKGRKNTINNPLLSSDESLWLWGICQSEASKIPVPIELENV